MILPVERVATTGRIAGSPAVRGSGRGRTRRAASRGPASRALASPWGSPKTNAEIAGRLSRIGQLLEAQGADGFRVRAYHAAAETVRELEGPIAGVLAAEGREGLEALPAIGRSISALIEEYLRTGRIGLLERLEGHVSPEDVLVRVPGIGRVLAERIHERLGIETLEELELAAHDGRLRRLPGFGPRRLAGIRASLAELLGRRSVRRRPDRRPPPPVGAPLIAALLAVDEEYRERAEAGSLRTIAPKRFNPAGRAWLPIYHTHRAGWSYTALYSNTALAHRLGRSRDWVVIYYERDGDEGQCTIVTEYRGELEGLRVVRGRERECRSYYGGLFEWPGPRSRKPPPEPGE